MKDELHGHSMAEAYGDMVLVAVSPQETRIATLCQGALEDLQIDREADRSMVGRIYLGKVQRVLAGMQSAFVDIGLGRTAFLHVAEVALDRASLLKPIEHQLFPGQVIVVQVIKDPIATKGARLSMRLSLAGRLLVYFPQDTHIGISQKIGDETQRESLRSRIVALMPAGCEGGFIVRTSAQHADDVALGEDIHDLWTRMNQVMGLAKTLAAPALLYDDLPLSLRVLRDVSQEHTVQIRIDDHATYVAMCSFAQRIAPHLLTRLVYHDPVVPLFEAWGVQAAIEASLARRVPMNAGAYLVIDPTEAMISVDVNTGAYVGRSHLPDTILRTNLDAARVIARECRRRNLGGMIVIDFIDMADDAHREQVFLAMQQAFARDRTKVNLSGFTALGLFELTRKRTRESLSQVLCQPCSSCGGNGLELKPETVAYDIQRDLIKLHHQQPSALGFEVTLSAAVNTWFDRDALGLLDTLARWFKQSIELKPEPAYPHAHYRIVAKL